MRFFEAKKDGRWQSARRFNFNASNDWAGDLSICIKAMKKLAIFCAAVGAVALALLPVYRVALSDAKPFDVYTEADWEVAVGDPFVSKVILHGDVPITNVPDRVITIIRDF